MAQIEDGKGTGNRAQVDSSNRLSVKAITEPELEQASEDGNAYIWISQNLDIDAADTLLLVKNTSDKDLHIHHITFSSGNVATRYEVHIVTADITPAGTTVTGFNMNTGSAKVADAISKSDETANTQGTVIYDITLLATTNLTLFTLGIILAKNISIGVDQVTESTSGNITIVGHFGD